MLTLRMMKMKALIYILMCGAAIAAATGCAGRSAQTGSQPDSEKPEAAKEAPKANADTLMAYVRLQTDCGPRVPGSEGWRQCANMLEAKLKALGADKVSVHTPTVRMADGRQVTIRNILAQTDTGNPRRVMLLAHWDTRPVADKDPDPQNYNKPIEGANDGASGVAVMMEILRLAAAERPGVGLDLLLVDAEDSGVDGDDQSWCIGSRQWVADGRGGATTSQPAFAILLDMVGGKGARFSREYFSDRYAPGVCDLVWQSARKLGYGDGKPFQDKVGAAITDDHVELIRGGIPTIDIIDADNPATGTFNPTWHTMADNTDNIEPQTMAAVANVVADVIWVTMN